MYLLVEENEWVEREILELQKGGIIENQVFKWYKGIEILSTNGSVNLEKEQR